MRKVVYLISLIAIFLGSCSTDLDIAADWKEIPIIYAIFNPVDTLHYIKVNKAFLDPTGNALEIAQIADSIFYQDSILVTVIRKDQWGNITDEYLPTVVDGNLIGLVKEEGTFADEPNWLYQLPLIINNAKGSPDESYELMMHNVNSGLTATATTKPVKQFDLLFPPEDVEFALPLAFMNIVDEAEYKSLKVQWANAENGREYELKLEFTYVEVEDFPGGAEDTLVIEWKPVGNISSSSTNPGETLEATILGESFYSFLAFSIEEKTGVYRRLVSKPIKFKFLVAGQELYDLIRVTQSQSGITSLQATTEYTNIENGLGIFSSRYNTTTTGFDLNQNSIDVLVCGDITSSLNFVGASCQ